jgi:uncharacterized XkdX family phage protein
MTINIKAIKTLFRAKRITVESVKKLVKDGLITEAQYKEITGGDIR